MAYVIAIYEADRQFGGPEEGGWWYESGTLCRIVATEVNEERAYDTCYRVQRILNCLQRNKRSISSVAYRGGRHVAQVFRHTAPQAYPEVRPHYE